ncbi:MAG: Ig domain-containing protein [Clostridia bacterium]|jgi:hypothetical protein|nr:Ig domain-containing protein [Clostridia bacterium]
MKTKRLLTVLLALVLSLPVLSSCGEVKFSLEETDLQMPMYEEHDLSFKLEGADRSDIAWSSSDPQTAVVQDGKITALSVGNAVITGEIAGIKKQCSVLVSRNRVGRALSVSDSDIKLEVGGNKTVSATFKENSEVLDVPVVWESSRPEVASVSETGTVTALSRGNAVVSAYTRYKGQRFTRDITVRVTVTKSEESALRFEDSAHTGSALIPIESGKTELGFTESDNVYRYETAGGFQSRVFVSGAYENGNSAKFDRMLFKVKFTEQPNEGTSLWLAGYKKVIKGMPNLVTQDSCFVFYDAYGKIAKSFDENIVYTVAVNLNKAGDGVNNGGEKAFEYGFAFNAAATAYLSDAVLCSEDYFSDTYGFEQPEELPLLNCVYAETGAGLDVGVEPIDAFDKYWVAYSSGTAAEWDNAIWDTRVAIGGIAFSQYRNYQYMRLDIMFTDVNIRHVMIWTGGYSLRYEPSGNVSSSESTPQEGDLNVFLGGEDVTGTPLEPNKAYTFRVRIQRDNIENVAFGFNVNSSSRNPVYFAAPTFTDY